MVEEVDAKPVVAPAPRTDRSTVELLRVTKTVTWVWVLVGLFVGLISLLSIMVSLLTLRFPGGGISELLYVGIWVVVDIMVLGKFDTWSGHLTRGEHEPLLEPLLLWGLLALIFGVLPGMLLLLLYFKISPWGSGAASTAGSPAAPPPSSSGSPPPYSPPPGFESPSSSAQTAESSGE